MTQTPPLPGTSLPASSRLANRPAVPIAAAAIIASAAIGLAMSIGTTPEQDWQLAARWTARVAAGFFLLVFLIGPLWRSRKAMWIAPLMRNRRYWGLAFATAHTLHLGALVMFYVVSEQSPALVTILGGGLAYVLIFSMVLTSNDIAQHALGPWWHRLHLTGMAYIWIIFAQSYAGRLSDPDRIWIGIIGTSAFAAALALRIAVRLFARPAIATRPKTRG